MWAIGTEKDVSLFLNQRALVSVFLSDGYNNEEIQWILDSWQGFNEDSGSNWHLLIPCNADAFVLNEKLDSRRYDVKLANRLIANHKINRNELPLLMFENYDIDASPKYISFRGMSRDEQIDMFRAIAQIVCDEAENTSSEPNEFRQRILDRVGILKNKHSMKKIVVKALGIGTAIFGVLSAAYSFR